MTFTDVDFYNSIAEEAFNNSCYKDKSDLSLITFSENATYKLTDKITGEPFVVMRISRPGYHTKEEIMAEIDWLNEIEAYTPLNIGRPLFYNGKDYIMTIEKGGKVFYISFFKFMKGVRFDENNEEDMIRNFKLLGETTAYLHRHVKIWNKAKTINRKSWDYESIIGENAIFGNWRTVPFITQEQKELFLKADKVIKRRLERYGKTEDNYGLIHSDLRTSNVLSCGNGLVLYDFDDCGRGWFLHDLACAVSTLEVSTYLDAIVNAWIDGYTKVLALSDTDIYEINTFIMQRRLQELAWLHSHSDSDPAKEVMDGFAEDTVILAERYLRNYM